MLHYLGTYIVFQLLIPEEGPFQPNEQLPGIRSTESPETIPLLLRFTPGIFSSRTLAYIKFRTDPSLMPMYLITN